MSLEELLASLPKEMRSQEEAEEEGDDEDEDEDREEKANLEDSALQDQAQSVADEMDTAVEDGKLCVLV